MKNMFTPYDNCLAKMLVKHDISMIDTLRKGDPTDGDKRRLERHREHFSGHGAKT